MGSTILSPDSRPHWEFIQRTEGGTAVLLRHYEEYASTLAQNMRKTYLSPFTIVTPNIGKPRRIERLPNDEVWLCESYR